MARWNPTYQIKLNDLFERNYGKKPIEVQRKLRPLLDSQPFIDVFGLQVIDRIGERTQSGIDKNGKQFAFYSRDYANSLIFKIYGKSKSNPNLTLTGEMLSSMIHKANKRIITIEMIGENNKAKAQGHVSGRLGRSKRIVKRDFLGLPKSEEDAIFKSVLDNLASESIDLSLALEQNAVNVALGSGINRSMAQVLGVAYETDY